MEVYNVLRKKVYEIIYTDGIPLTFGCEVIVTGRKKDLDSTGLYLSNDGVDDLVYYKDSHCLDTFDPSEENLGPDLTLQSILRAIDERIVKGINFSVCTISEGFLNITFMEQNNPLKIKLSKQPKEREEETLTSIQDLLS